MTPDPSTQKPTTSAPPTAFSDTLAGTALGALAHLYNITVAAVRANEKTREPKRSKAIQAAVRAEIENSQHVQDAYNDWALPAWLALVEADMKGTSSAAGGQIVLAASGQGAHAPGGGPVEGAGDQRSGVDNQREDVSPPSPAAAPSPNPSRRGAGSMAAAKESTTSIFDSYTLPSGHVLARTPFHVLPRLRRDHAEASVLIGLVQNAVDNPDPYTTPADYLNESDYETMIKAALTGKDV